jgi:exonuclease SbcC
MRFDFVRFKGFGPFVEEQTIDFTQFEPGSIVAICGENGAGKSTVLELLAGSIDRETPTRGTLGELAVARDAFVEVHLATARGRYGITQRVDAKTGNGTSVVVNLATGEPILSNGSRTDFDAWRARWLPPSSVYFSTCFCPQKTDANANARGVLAMKPAKRKDVLVRVVGAERHQREAKRCAERAAEVEREVEKLNVAIAEQEKLAGASVIAAEIERAKEELSRLAEAHRDALAKVETARARAKVVGEQKADYDRVTAERQGVEQQIADVDAKLRDLRARIENNRKLLEREGEVRRAVARKVALDAELMTLKTTQAELETARASADVGRAAEALRRVRDEIAKTAGARATRTAWISKTAADIEMATAALASLKPREALLETEHTEASAKVEDLAKVSLVSAEGRIVGLRAGLEAISAIEVDSSGDVLEPVYELAEKTLSDDDAAVVAATTVPAQIAAARATKKRLAAELETIRRDILDANLVVAREESLTRERLLLEEATEKLAAMRQTETTEDEAQRAAQERADSCHDDLAQCEAKIRANDIERAGLEDDIRFAGKLDEAQGRLDAYVTQETELTAERARLENTLTALAQPPAPGPAPDLDAADRTVTQARAAISAHERALAVLEERHQRASAAEARLAELTDKRKAADADLADWARLADDYGRDGMQAFAIDAAAPAINDYLNRLLRECVGTRWTGKLETTYMDSKGKKQLEGCNVTIYDSEKFLELPGHRLSGGEGTIIGEALALALTVVGVNSSEMIPPTLVRDEVGSALDPRNSIAYVEMLRRAAAETLAPLVLFVSHDLMSQSLADRRILIENGRVILAGKAQSQVAA